VLRPLIVAAALALALGAGGASARPGGGAEEAFVTVEDESLVVSVMLDTGEVSARIAVPRGPRDVAIRGDRRFLLVSSPPAGKVTLIDSFRHHVVETFGGFGSPRGIEIAGRYAYVADEARGEIVVLDLEKRKRVGRVAVGPRPQHLAIGDRGLVSHAPEHPELTVLNMARPRAPRVDGELPAGGAAFSVSKQPDTANAYVTYWSSGMLGGVDWGRRLVLWKRRVGSVVHDVAFDYYHGQRLWVSDSRAGEVLAVRSRDGRVLRRLRRCPGARQVHFGPGRGHIVSACRDAGTLFVLDPVRERSSRIRVGARPYGVVVAYVP
jgi:DNA-binding beta-propeller fold protein YncE